MIFHLPLRITRPAILLFGDSITQQGFGWVDGSTTIVGWSSLLARDYTRRADVLNRGYSGYNTNHAVDILTSGDLIDLEETQTESTTSYNYNDDFDNKNCNMQSRVQQPVLFSTIFFGANDAALPGELQHVPVDVYGENLATIIKYMRSNSKKPSTVSSSSSSSSSDDLQEQQQLDFKENLLPIILFTPPPVDITAWYKERGEPKKTKRNDRANENAKLYGDKVKKIASEMDCSVLDVFELLGGNGRVEEFGKHLRDGLHLSESGNVLVYQGLMTLLQRTYPHLLPMKDGQGKYGNEGIPLEGKLWRELC